MCGCVVLNTGVPPTEFYNKAPYVKLDDWNQLVEAMDMLLNNEKKMEEMSQKSKEWYQDFVHLNPYVTSSFLNWRAKSENQVLCNAPNRHRKGKKFYSLSWMS